MIKIVKFENQQTKYYNKILGKSKSKFYKNWENKIIIYSFLSLYTTK